MTKTYFLPKALGYALDSDPGKLLQAEEIVAQSGDLLLPGFLISGSRREMWNFIQNAPIESRLNIGHRLRKFLKEANINPSLKVYENIPCIHKDVNYPIISDVSNPVWMIENITVESEEMTPVFTDLLMRMSVCTGYEFKITCMRGDFYMPQSAGERELTVVIGGTPYGRRTYHKSRTICDVFLGLHPDLHPEPIYGLGTIIYDDQDNAIAQIYKSTIYILIGAESFSAKAIVGNDLLVEKILIQALNAIGKGLKDSPRKKIRGLKSLTEASGQMQKVFVDAIEDAYVKAKKDVEVTKRAYQHALMAEQDVTRTLKALRERDPYTPSKEDWIRIKQIPGIREIYTQEEGVCVDTERVYMEHEGKIYDLGEFLIRISLLGDVAIYQLAHTHPEGIPHPHIMKEGNPCFGNVSIPLQEAASQYRIADALEIVVSWLFEGYEEALTLHPISEWPEKEEAACLTT